MLSSFSFVSLAVAVDLFAFIVARFSADGALTSACVGVFFAFTRTNLTKSHLTCLYKFTGGRHAMALTVDGKVFSWGEGDDGKLGHYSRTYVTDSTFCYVVVLCHLLNPVSQ